MAFAVILYYYVLISRAWQTLSSDVSETKHGVHGDVCMCGHDIEE
jgi:hypothetical protein